MVVGRCWGGPCECDGRHCGLFDESVCSMHEHSLQGLPFNGARRRQVDCVGRLMPVSLMLLED